MNLGFDFDKILINYPPFIPHGLIDRLYKQKKNGILLYRIPSRPEQLLRLITHQPIFRPPIIENILFVKKISKQRQYRCYLLSSRFSFLKNVTDKLIKQHQFHKIFDGLYFNFKNNQPHLFKNESIKKLKIDRYVDDDLPLLEFVAGNNPKTIFFWLNKTKSKKLKKNLFAITELSQIFT